MSFYKTIAVKLLLLLGCTDVKPELDQHTVGVIECEASVINELIDL